MNWKRALGLAAAVILVTAATASAVGPRSGLYGTVTRGPISPVCRAGVPCDAPAPNVILTFTRLSVLKTTRTDQHGTYRVELGPGTYTVRTSLRPFGQITRPAIIHVRGGHFDKIDFTLDTGIR